MLGWFRERDLVLNRGPGGLGHEAAKSGGEQENHKLHTLLTRGWQAQPARAKGGEGGLPRKEEADRTPAAAGSGCEVLRFRAAREKVHPGFAPAGTGSAASSLARSFSHRPSKLPLDMMSKRSLALALATRKSAMASPPETTSASLPSVRTEAATVSGSRRFSSPSCCARKTPPSATQSASARACGRDS